MNDFWTVLSGSMIGLVSLLTAFLAYRRGQKADDRAVVLAANTQVYAEYRSLIEGLRNELAEARRDSRREITGLRREISEVRLQLSKTLQELDDMRRKALNGHP